MTNYGYIYKTENDITGDAYIGQTSRPFNKTLKYYGSGVILTRAIKKYAKSNFTKIILMFCESQDQLNRMERLYIKLFSPTYNIYKGGKGEYKLVHTDVTKKKISEAHKGKKWSEARILAGHHSSIEASNKGKPWSEARRSAGGHKWTDEQKKEISARKKGIKVKTHITTEEHKRNISKALTGKKPSEATKEKIRQSLLARRKNISSREEIVCA